MASSSSSSRGASSKGKEVVVEAPVEEEVATAFGKIQLASSSSSSGASPKGKQQLVEAPVQEPLPEDGPEEDDESSRVIVVLVASDGTKFEVPARVAKEMNIVKNLLDDEAEGSTIPIADVAPSVLSTLLDYCYKHAGAKGSTKALNDWDTEYARRATADTDHLYFLLLAADYLEVLGLLELLFQSIAGMLRGNSTEEMRQMFKIRNDLEPEEVQRWKDMNPRAFENEEEQCD